MSTPTIRRPRSTVRAGAVAALTLGLALIAGPAAAHVTVSTDDDRRGAQDVLLTFRVPNDADDTTTVKVEVKLPSKTPLGAVLPSPVQGWTFTTSKVDLDAPVSTDDGAIARGVATVTWTADRGTKGIPVGGFETFQLLVGPLPEDATTLAFPTVQTYANGTSASWIDPVTDPANPPDSPAPVLVLRAADAGPGSETGPSTGAARSGPAGGAAEASGNGPGAYAIAGLVLGALGTSLGGLAFWRTGRRT